MFQRIKDRFQSKPAPAPTTEEFPPLGNPPYHVGIIMDGNGRWAKQRGKARLQGHQAGTENLRRILTASVEFGVKMLTIYAFSTENWRRSDTEVSGLMRILETVIDRELDDLNKNGVQIRHIGQLDQLNSSLQTKIQYALDYTKHNEKLVLNVAFNYGGRHEIVNAVKKLMRDHVSAEDVSEDLLSKYMYTGGYPDPDLIIRTSGEFRISNFLIWQAAYAEYYITPTYWPDFDKAEYYRALTEFATRHRRYGGRNNEKK